MKAMLLSVAAVAAMTSFAEAQTLTYMRAIESAHYDPARQSAGAELIYLVGDTLVSLDYDLRTIKPLLAKSWTVSPDGRLYTFTLRDDVTFCSGRKFTADDVVYSFKRVLDKDIKSPFYWRMGKVKDIRAPNPTTVEYELEQPFSELLPNLAIFHATILNKDNVEELGKDFGVKGFDGTGPFCWESWEPRNQAVVKRRPEYKWGPPFYQNQGPAKYDKIVFKIVPEEAARLAAMASGQMDMTALLPDQYLPQAAKMPNLQVLRPAAELRTFYYGFKITRDNVSDVRVRKALSLAIDRKAIVDSVYFGNARPAATYIQPGTPDYDPSTTQELGQFDVAQSARLLDEAGWKMGSDGFRAKDGKRLTLQLYGFQGGRSPKIGEAVQGYWRKIGVDLQLQMWDGTIVFSKLAQQDYDIWSISFPYHSAGDALLLYFHSRNIPTPNRMNWKDPETDRLLDAASAALNEKERFENYGKVQKIIHENVLWMPILYEGVQLVVNKRVKNVKAHNLYATMIYKALDFTP